MTAKDQPAGCDPGGLEDKAPAGIQSLPIVADPVLTLSDERDAHLGRLLAAERAAYQRGHDDGYDAGYLAGCHDAETALEQSWAAIAVPVSHGRHPVADGWELRLAAAQAYTRRRALAHWDEYLRRAIAEHPARRTGEQRAFVTLTQGEASP